MLDNDVSSSSLNSLKWKKKIILSFLGFFLATIFRICAGRQSSENQSFVMSQVRYTSFMSQ